MVSQRGLEVLRAIVTDYVSSREPVGSKSIVDRHSFGVSAATIRNDMALLEEEELIAAPHTSSGRIPTDKGYRLFVDHLAEVKQISSTQRQAIERFLDESGDFDELLGRTVRLLAQLTNQVAIVQYPSLGLARVRHVELVKVGPRRALSILITDNGRVDQRLVELETELDDQELAQLGVAMNTRIAGKGLGDVSTLLADVQETIPHPLTSAATVLRATLSDQAQVNRQQRLVLAGTANLVRTGEDFVGSIYPMLDAIEEQVILLKLFTEMAGDGPEVAVGIGHELGTSALDQTSLMTTSYASAGQRSTLGLLGPTRMDYSNNMAAVRAVARYLTRALDVG
jgi:heat-inducible transcriptional repressor